MSECKQCAERVERPIWVLIPDGHGFEDIFGGAGRMGPLCRVCTVRFAAQAAVMALMDRGAGEQFDAGDAVEFWDPWGVGDVRRVVVENGYLSPFVEIMVAEDVVRGYAGMFYECRKADGQLVSIAGDCLRRVESEHNGDGRAVGAG